MRVGLISDVHANAAALNVVLDDIPSVDQILHAGDIVGYGPHPHDVIAMFRGYDIRSIRGNHDRGIDSFNKFENRYSKTAIEALRWTRDQLTEQEKGYLSNLPDKLTISDGCLHVVHGSPVDPDKYVYSNDISPELLNGEDVLVIGHTHEQVVRGFADGLVINPGSVGQPRDGDTTAAYAVVDLDTYNFQLGRVEYPVIDVKKDIYESELPDKLAESL